MVWPSPPPPPPPPMPFGRSAAKGKSKPGPFRRSWTSSLASSERSTSCCLCSVLVVHDESSEYPPYRPQRRSRRLLESDILSGTVEMGNFRWPPAFEQIPLGKKQPKRQPSPPAARTSVLSSFAVNLRFETRALRITRRFAVAGPFVGLSPKASAEEPQHFSSKPGDYKALESLWCKRIVMRTQ